MAKDLTKYYDTSRLESKEIGQAIDDMMNTAKSSRRNFERKWYENNFFDDGHHFRYLSRLQNKIIDLSEKASIYAPMRAIPKASRQIRGLANLLTSQDYIAVIYPEKVEKANYEPQEYETALKEAKMVAKRSGHWIEEEFKNQDIKNKLSLMSILSAKNYISYLQVFPDAEKEKIVTVVRDAFDVYVMGELNELEDSPYAIIAHPKVISEIKANELFDKEQRMKINPDNRHASSEIKEAYMKGKFGREFNDDSTATIILKEGYLKEHLNSDNFKIIKKQRDAMDILRNKDEGDIVYRQVFAAGNIELYDKYVDLPGYPLVDFRYEPGPLYGVSVIERFIPSNKSLDMVMSRIERYTNTMAVGVWMKRQGEQFNLTNASGGQVIEYKSVPPQQGAIAPLPAHVFNFVELLNEFIEEQGVTTTTLGKIPAGVKSGTAIESLKESEYANLVIPQRMFKETIKRIAQKFLDYADKYFISPQTVYFLEKGEPQYFDIIGKSAMDKRAELNVPVEGEVVPLSKESRVDIEVQSGLAYTQEGKKAAAKDLGDYMIQLAQLGLLPPEAVTVFLGEFLKTFQFGPTGDIVSKMEEFTKSGMINDSMLEKIKLAVAEVIKESGIAEEDEQHDIEKIKVAVAEALKDTGVTENVGGLEEEKTREEMKLKREEHEQKIVQSDEKSQIEKAKAVQEMTIKERQARESSEMKKEMAKHQMKVSEKMANKIEKKGKK